MIRLTSVEVAANDLWGRAGLVVTGQERSDNRVDVIAIFQGAVQNFGTGIRVLNKQHAEMPARAPGSTNERAGVSFSVFAKKGLARTGCNGFVKSGVEVSVRPGLAFREQAPRGALVSPTSAEEIAGTGIRFSEEMGRRRIASICPTAFEP